MFDFGPNAAQDDPNLLDYYQETNQVKRLFSGGDNYPRCIFVSRPGSGKTALVKWLESKISEYKVMFIKPTETRFIVEDDFSNVEDYRLVISTELMMGILSAARHKKWISDPVLTRFNGFFNQEWLKKGGNSLLSKFEGLSILGCGFSLKAGEKKSYLEGIRKTGTTDALKRLITEFSRGTTVTLVVDDPEFITSIGLEDVSAANSKRIGAFLSVLNNLHSLGVRVLVFTKEHIMQSIQEYYRDFAHFENRIEGLEWTKEDFINLLSKRIEKRLYLKWDNVFDISQEDFTNLVIPFLVNGPRDLVNICNMAGQGDSTITKNIIQKSIAAYKSMKWRDIRTQYNDQWPGLDVFAKTIISLVTEKHQRKPISPKQFHRAFEKEYQAPDTALHDLRKEQPWINSALWSSPSIEEKLYLVGVLGYYFEGIEYFPWSGRSLEKFRLADSYFISPTFW